MPTGKAHSFPSGFWALQLSPTNNRALFLRSCTQASLFILASYALYRYREISWTHTYTSFKGKSLSYGPLTQLTHEPLTTDEVDKLKATKRHVMMKS